ncbi:MAG: hypothetical protein ACKO47_03765 [Alphaproteobacteria bacterium]
MNNLRNNVQLNNVQLKPSRINLILSILDDMQNLTAKLRNDISREYRRRMPTSSVNSVKKLTSNNPHGHTL